MKKSKANGVKKSKANVAKKSRKNAPGRAHDVKNIINVENEKTTTRPECKPGSRTAEYFENTY